MRRPVREVFLSQMPFPIYIFLLFLLLITSGAPQAHTYYTYIQYSQVQYLLFVGIFPTNITIRLQSIVLCASKRTPIRKVLYMKLNVLCINIFKFSHTKYVVVEVNKQIVFYFIFSLSTYPMGI